MNLFKFLGGSKKQRGRSTVSQQTQENIKYEWVNIRDLLQSKGPSQLRQALISADKCLDNALRDVVPGETMGERLKEAESKFDRVTYDKIWKAHKVRNNLVHEAGYEPPHHVMTGAIEDLRRGLSSLGIRL